MFAGLNSACVNNCSHFNHSSYCVLFYCIVWLRLSTTKKRIWWWWWYISCLCA